MRTRLFGLSCPWSFVFWVVVLALLRHSKEVLGVVLSIWTQGQVSVMSAGQTAELDCEFYSESYHMFNNPVVWKKFQRHEETEINIMGNILHPFLSTNRFLVTFTNNSPRYRLRLRITDLSLEDSGNYTCLVRGAKATVLGSVTHYIFVRAPVLSVYFVTRNISLASPDIEEDLLSSELTVVQGLPVSLRCVSVGGYPPPDVYIRAGDKDVTDQFSSVQSPTMVGEKGLRLLQYRIERWTDGLRLSADDDGMVYRCLSVVSDVGSLLAAVKVYVNYGPRIRCLTSWASVGEKNVYLMCEVRSRPSLGALYWQIDPNGTTVSEGRVRDEYWTLVMVRTDDTIETRLFMRRVSPDSFRKYTIFAENAIDTTQKEVELLEKHSPPTIPLTILELRHHQTKGREASPPRGDPDNYLHSYSTSQSLRDDRISGWTLRHLATLSILTTELISLIAARVSTTCNLFL